MIGPATSAPSVPKPPCPATKDVALILAPRAPDRPNPLPDSLPRGTALRYGSCGCGELLNRGSQKLAGRGPVSSSTPRPPRSHVPHTNGLAICHSAHDNRRHLSFAETRPFGFAVAATSVHCTHSNSRRLRSEEDLTPRVFISYSWSSPGHQARIRQWAEQMVNDGVDVVLDVWDLKEGDDKYAFMEKMVTDASVSHVLVFSDSEYAAKADARKAGVGTESQIISREVYSKVQQSKFIPIACEFDESGEPLLPTFLKSRIWIDFSSPEAANENWERLVRVLYGKPAHTKPALGRAPTFVAADFTVPPSPALGKFAALRHAIIQDKVGLKLYRQDFLDACCDYADALRIRERPDLTNLGQRVLEDCGRLKLVRDHIVDWVLLESGTKPSAEFDEALLALLERLLELKSRPAEVNSWNESWFEAHRVFVYETFLYTIAALLKADSFDSLHLILTSHYLLPETEGYGAKRFGTFDAFYGHSETLQILAPEGRRLNAPAAELIKRQADRTDLPFAAVIQAELLVLMMALIVDGAQWHPQTLNYSSHAGRFPFFLRAARRRDFLKLAKVTGVESGDQLRAAVKAGLEELRVDGWRDFASFWSSMNMDALDTLS
ncbi:TIR domain-containing protein [Luteitalea sp.]